MPIPEHYPRAIQLSRTGIAVGLQDPAEVFEMSTGMLPLAIRRVSKPYRRRRRVACGSVIAHIRPQARRFGFAGAMCKCANRRVIGVDFMTTHDMAVEGVDQRPEQLAALADPVGQGRAFQIHALAGVDLGLSIQRKMVNEFGDQHGPEVQGLQGPVL